MSESWVTRVQSGGGGFIGATVRAALVPCAYLYEQGVRWRNRSYDLHGASMRVAAPVISVGNITVGGTGKTPLVMELVRRLERRGRSVAVIAHGYGAGPGEANDEELLIRKRCPAVTYVADTHRGRGAELAIRAYGADALVLDDGFQHRRLHRDLDIVLVDATCPFGFDHLLPRGRLREPPRGLRRAGLIVLSRCDQVSRDDLDQLEARLHRIAPEVPLVRSRHRVERVERLNGEVETNPLEGRRVGLFAGIGNPRSFETTVRGLGAEVIFTRWWPDHHRYRPRDLRGLWSRSTRGASPELLITTEKDAVKLALLPRVEADRIAYPRIAIDFEKDGGTILDQAIDGALRDHAKETATGDQTAYFPR